MPRPQCASDRPRYDARKPPAWAAQIFRPGNRSRVPSKIRCERNTVVSSGLPMMLPKPPLPCSRVFTVVPGACCGCMKTTTPSCSAFAQNGSNLRSDSSCPSQLPPIATPRSPSFLTASSSCSAARSGYCIATGAQATAATPLRKSRRVVIACRLSAVLSGKGLVPEVQPPLDTGPERADRLRLADEEVVGEFAVAENLRVDRPALIQVETEAGQ